MLCCRKNPNKTSLILLCALTSTKFSKKSFLPNQMKKVIYFLLCLSFFVELGLSNALADDRDLLRRASVLVEAGRIDEAALLMRGYQPQGRSDEYAFYLLGGKVAMARGQAKRGVDYFERAQSLSDGGYAATVGLAQAHLKLGQFVAARLQADAARALKSIPTDSELIYAEVEERMGKRDKAIQRMEALSRTYPSSEEVVIARARLLARVGETSAAKGLLSQFTEAHPSSAGAVEFLGELTYLDGDRAVGVQLKQRAAELYAQQGSVFRRDVVLAWVEVNEASSADVLKKFSDDQARESTPRPTARAEKFPFPDGAITASGSGFVIDGGRKVVTNRHVVDGGKEFAIRTGLGEVVRARIAMISQTDDLAILELEKPLPPESAVSDTGYAKPMVGTAILVMGFPLSHVLGDNAPSLTNGIVSKITGLKDDVTTFQMTAKVNKGNSGGPVFDMQGNIVGITFAKLDSKRINQEQGFIPEDINFAIHVDRLPAAANTRINANRPVSGDLGIEALYQQMLGKVVMVVTYR
jgi:serine protease Do